MPPSWLLLWNSRPFLLFLLLLVSEQVSAQNPAPRDLPTSPRARAAAEDVREGLTRDLANAGMRYGNPVFIRILKEEAELELFVQEMGKKTFKLFRTYQIAAMSGQLGPKEREGDLQAPEGFYYVPPRRMNPHSRFHLSFNLGYPNAYDRAHGRDGSHLMVHGNRVSIGCFAMTDPKIEEIYTLCHAALANGQQFFRVHSFPFRMTAARMEQSRSNKWHAFWKNLRQGYAFFEQHRFPPDVRVTGKRYVFD
ncbi:MAG: murein L,D-transpeptidase [Roseibacillus sp.]|nr:murein L,D-transpeptidase [Roseibacillus sp.]